jgi:histidinol-phosphate aminotransferase
MKNHTHDLDAMLKAIDSRTKIVFVSNPNNPTGTAVEPAKLDAFVRSVPPSVVVAIDEAYVELMPPELQPNALRYVREGAGATVMLFRTFSKIYGLAGLRVGYAVATSDAIELMNRMRQPFNVNAMALEAARAALADDQHVERTRRVVREGLAFYENSFREMGLNYVPSAANFILVETGRGRDTFQALLREGIIVRPMDAYGLPAHVRITVGTGEENKKCVKALKKVLGKAK